MMLADVLQHHRGALRASLRAAYQLRLEDAFESMGARELAELVRYLPGGSALWQSVGGPMAWSDEVRALKELEHRLRVLAWQPTEDAKHRRNVPEPQPPPAYAYEQRLEEQVTQRRVEKYLRRHRRRQREETPDGG